MPRRYLAIWLPYLATDRLIKIDPDLKDKPFVLAATEKGRMVIKASSPKAMQEGIAVGKVLADARAIMPALQEFDYEPEVLSSVLEALAEWCMRFSPIAAVDGTDGIILDVSGCPHLWGGEEPYLQAITARMAQGGYHIKAAIADTIGTAWAVARYSAEPAIVEIGKHSEALTVLPPEALRLESAETWLSDHRPVHEYAEVNAEATIWRFADTALRSGARFAPRNPEAGMSY